MYKRLVLVAVVVVLGCLAANSAGWISDQRMGVIVTVALLIIALPWLARLFTKR